MTTWRSIEVFMLLQTSREALSFTGPTCVLQGAQSCRIAAKGEQIPSSVPSPSSLKGPHSLHRRSMGRISAPFEVRSKILVKSDNLARTRLFDGHPGGRATGLGVYGLALLLISLSLLGGISSGDSSFYFKMESTSIVRTRASDGTLLTKIDRSVRTNAADGTSTSVEPFFELWFR